MIRFRTAVYAIIAVLVVHAVAIGMDWYHAVKWFDIPMHFLGGYVIALLALATWGWIRARVDIRQKSSPRAAHARLLLEGIFVLGFVMMIGVGWEWYEFIFDQFATVMVEKIGVAQMGLPDTMDDLLNDTLGGMTAWAFWRSKV